MGSSEKESRIKSWSDAQTGQQPAVVISICDLGMTQMKEKKEG